MQIYRSRSLHLARLKVDYANILNVRTDKFDKVLMRRVLVDIIVPVFYTLKLHHETMREPSLYLS